MQAAIRHAFSCDVLSASNHTSSVKLITVQNISTRHSLAGCIFLNIAKLESESGYEVTIWTLTFSACSTDQKYLTHLMHIAAWFVTKSLCTAVFICYLFCLTTSSLKLFTVRCIGVLPSEFLKQQESYMNTTDRWEKYSAPWPSKHLNWNINL